MEYSSFETINYEMICHNIADNLKCIMDKRNFSQKGLSAYCGQMGVKISQATISNLLNASQNCSLANLISLCNVLEISLEELISSSKSKNSYSDIKIENGFITNPRDRAFKGYLDSFTTYFYQTIGKNSELLKGTLILKSKDEICAASLTLNTGDLDKQHTPIQKTYTGQMLISIPMHSAYIYLVSNDACEICLLAFNHFHLINKTLKCVMAEAVTISAGSNRRPTIHRVCIANGDISPDILPYIKGQLLLNEAEIFISANKLEAFKKDDRVLPEFLDLLSGAIQNERYYSITEAKLTGNNISESELIKMVSLLRSYSISPKYNKISRKTDDAVYNLLENNLIKQCFDD